MKKCIKKVIASLAILMLVLGLSITAYAKTAKNYTQMSSISKDVYTALLNTLHAHADASTAGTLYDTGVICSGEEFQRLRTGLTKLFSSENIVITHNDTHLPYAEVVNVRAKQNGYNYQISYHGGYKENESIYVGFLPDSNPAEEMRRYDATVAAIQEALCSAPSDIWSLIEYCADWELSKASYDYSCATDSHFGYSLVFEGKAVCESYSSVFATMMWLTGNDCYFITDKEKNHAFCVVPVNGTMYTVDLTEQSGYLKVSGDSIIAYLNEPFFTE